MTAPAASELTARSANPWFCKASPKLILSLAAGVILVAMPGRAVVHVAFPDLSAHFPAALPPALSWAVAVIGCAVLFAALFTAAGRWAASTGPQHLSAWSVAASTVRSKLAAAAGFGLVRPSAATAEGAEGAGGREPAIGRRGRAVALVAGLASLAGVGAFAVAANADGCSGDNELVIRVGVVPEIESPVSGAVERFNEARHDVDGRCVTAQTALADPAQVATMLGQGTAIGVSSLPDVWIPDSSSWISSVLSPVDGGKGARIGELTPTSVAQSPIVLGMPSALAGKLQSRGVTGELPWEALTAAAGGWENGAGVVFPPGLVRLRLPDPTHNAVGLGAALVLDQLRAAEPDRQDKLTAMVRSMRNDVVPDVAAGFAEFRRDSEGPYPVLVTAEQAVYAHNRRNPAEVAVALYPREGTLMMDYPYTVVTVDPVRVEAARLLEAEVQAEPTREAVRALGFRSDDGTAPTPAPPPAPAPAPAPVTAIGPPAGANPLLLPTPLPVDVHRVMQAWYQMSAGARDVAVVDVSASMAEEVGPRLTRLQATAQIVQGRLGPMPDGSDLGVWLMGSRLRGNEDWVELAPVGALGERIGPATRRKHIDSGLGQVGAVADDRTGLYDSVLAAFRMMNRTYRPDVANSVLVFTDSRNDDPGGISLENLVSALRGEYDPARPVHIIMIAYGDGVDRGALRQIADATGGNVQIVDRPEQLPAILGK